MFLFLWAPFWGHVATIYKSPDSCFWLHEFLFGGSLTNESICKHRTTNDFMYSRTRSTHHMSWPRYICIFHGQSKVPIPALALDDRLPTDLTDLELFRKFCMPFHETDRWEEAPWSNETIYTFYFLEGVFQLAKLYIYIATLLIAYI